jgi:Protein of unknown function (DUF3034)
MRSCSSVRCITAVLLFVGSFLFILTPMAMAQLNWEGQTGAFATPFAYVVSSESAKIGHPEVAFHYLNGGSVLGNDYQFSFTVGLFKITEFGFTRSTSSSGSSPITGLFQGGYDTFHGKLNMIGENAGKTKWVPAISAGFAARFEGERVARAPFATNLESPLAGRSTNNLDFYLVATKTITQIKGLPIVLSGGYKRTNAQIMGVAGNSPDYANTLFGAAAFVVKGPAKTALVFGAEAVQQPHYLEGLSSKSTGGPTIPTTLVYFVRVVPGKLPFNVDFGVGQFAGLITPGIDLKARHQAAMGLSYRF